MDVYRYRCEIDGSFDVCCAVGAAGPSAQCPSCGGLGVRVPSSSRASRSAAA